MSTPVRSAVAHPDISTVAMPSPPEVEPAVDASRTTSIPLNGQRQRHDNGGDAAASRATAAMPPAMASVKQKTADDVLEMLNRTPLFMTSLDETDGEGGENVELEAMKALAYEGSRVEVAANFREQGNEQARLKRWSDASVFYTKALAALRGLPPAGHIDEDGAPDVKVLELDDDADAAVKEKAIEEACYVNRALCNLELKNFRSCIQDCASTLRLNPHNIKAYYRSSSACLALDKIAEASDALAHGTALDPTNTSLQTLSSKIITRKTQLDRAAHARHARETQHRNEARTLALALTNRNIRTRTSSSSTNNTTTTSSPPDLHDAAIHLSSPIDATSTLSLPVLLLYPLNAQSDLIKSFAETDTLASHLAYILPPPWDTPNDNHNANATREAGKSQPRYTPASVECYIETSKSADADEGGSGRRVPGLIKAGKKLPLARILGGGKVDVVDGLVTVNVVPRGEAAGWVDGWKRRMGLG